MAFGQRPAANTAQPAVHGLQPMACIWAYRPDLQHAAHTLQPIAYHPHIPKLAARNLQPAA